MNNPDDMPIDIGDLQSWLEARMVSRNLTWPAIARESGIPQGTISQFRSGVYNGGKLEEVAKRVFRYRQWAESQEDNAVLIPDEPEFIETQTSQAIEGMLIRAHGNRMTVVATGPGTGKTMTIKHYADAVPNVCVITMEPATKTISGMMFLVMQALGMSARTTARRIMAAEIANFLSNKSRLLVFDEANHLDYESLEQIRSWHDKTKTGVCLLGNQELVALIRRSGNRHSFGRLNSRLAYTLEQDQPKAADVEVYLDAWKIKEDAARLLLKRVALTPSSGGLREIKFIIESASMLAQLDGSQHLTLAHLREAKSTRATSYIREAA
jgi:DNA transposition AAA+ family ATPase